jgi:hypothetical protein
MEMLINYVFQCVARRQRYRSNIPWVWKPKQGYLRNLSGNNEFAQILPCNKLLKSYAIEITHRFLLVQQMILLGWQTYPAFESDRQIKKRCFRGLHVELQKSHSTNPVDKDKILHGRLGGANHAPQNVSEWLIPWSQNESSLAILFPFLSSKQLNWLTFVGWQIMH